MPIGARDRPHYRTVSMSERLYETNVAKYDGRSAININSTEIDYFNKTIDVYVLPTLFKTELQYHAKRQK
jgi:hypothetical protein